jgi:hypothetical protein
MKPQTIHYLHVKMLASVGTEQMGSESDKSETEFRGWSVRDYLEQRRWIRDGPLGPRTAESRDKIIEEAERGIGFQSHAATSPWYRELRCTRIAACVWPYDVNEPIMKYLYTT